MEPGVGLDSPCGSLSTQNILWFHDSVIIERLSNLVLYKHFENIVFTKNHISATGMWKEPDFVIPNPVFLPLIIKGI